MSELTVNEMFTQVAQRMQADNLPDLVIDTFKHYYAQLVNGHTGLISEADIQPVDHLPDAESFSTELATVGERCLSQTILLKLNGGLGTSMGLAQAKSLLSVKNGLSFLDIIARQAQQSKTPLVLMNSFSTHDDSLALLEKYPELQGPIPLDFLQHKVPKITQTDFSPVQWPENRELEWCPPGHGDIYPALVTSGMLDKLLSAGYQYAFVSNADNLGAVMDVSILGYFAKNKIPFMMEVADRTKADRKGGHLARLPSGQLILRESAQCPAEDTATFQNITRHKYFNTNNLWLNLSALQSALAEQNNILELPMIRNRKTVDPRKPESTPVYQLETAMGSAIGVFAGAQAVRVPRTRFAPVKTTNDFLAVQSDLYQLTEDFKVVLNPQRQLGSAVIDLDPTYYKLVSDMNARFPDGVPSLIECQSLTVKGDFKFGAGVNVVGTVELVNQSAHQVEIADGEVVDQNRQW